MPTLLEYCTALARALDDLETYTVASASANTAVVSALVNTTTAASDRRYDGRWAAIGAGAGAGVQGVVKGGGYAPSTGTLTGATSWPSTVYAGDTLLLTGHFPIFPTGLGADTSYVKLVYDALGLLMVSDVVSETTVAGQYEYPLTTLAPWLDRPSRLVAVLDPPRAANYPTRPSWRRNWELQVAGGVPTLQFFSRPYPVSGQTFELQVLRPSRTLVNGANSTTGPVAMTDTAGSLTEDVTTVGLMLAYEALMNRSPGRPSGEYATKYAAMTAASRALAAWDRTRETPQQAAPATSGAA